MAHLAYSVLKQALRYAVSLLLLVAAWLVVARACYLPTFILPRPTQVATTLFHEREFFCAGLKYTVQNAFLGAILGIGGGFLSGLVVASVRPLRWVFEPYLVIFQSFPREALVPLFVVWMGFGASPKILSAAMLSYFPMTLLTINGLLDTRREYIELVRSWGANRLEEMLYCRLPALVPTLVGGIGKVCLPLALIGAVLGEMTGGGNEGLGYVIVTAGSVSRVDRIFGAIVILGLVGTLALGAVNAVQFGLRRFNQE